MHHSVRSPLGHHPWDCKLPPIQGCTCALGTSLLPAQYACPVLWACAVDTIEHGWNSGHVHWTPVCSVHSALKRSRLLLFGAERTEHSDAQCACPELCMRSGIIVLPACSVGSAPRRGMTDLIDAQLTDAQSSGMHTGQRALPDQPA